MYSSELQSGVCRGGGASPEIVRQTVATALVEGHNLMGKYPPPPFNYPNLDFCMESLCTLNVL